MEFNRMFTIVQGVLRSFQKSSGVKLTDITEDYPEELDRLIAILRDAINENNWDKGSQRKIHLFLVLNTDFQNVSLLEEDENFRHLIGTLPELNSFVYVQLVTRLDWHEFVGEVVLHCPEALVRDILFGFERSLKHIQSEGAVPFFYTLYDALFRKITLLQDVCKHRTLEFVKLFKILAKYKFKEVVKSVECTPDESKFYLGFVYRMYIKLVESCIGWLQNRPLIKEEIYAFKIYYDYTVWPESNMTNWAYHCLGVVASAAAEISEDVDIDTYIVWNDTNIPEDPSKSLQMSVREAAYNTRAAIASMPHLRNSVSGLSQLESRLECIAIRPTTEDDEIVAADLESLIDNLKDSKRNQVKWLNALIERDIFENESVLNAIKNRHDVATVDTVLLLLDRAAIYIKDNPQKCSDSVKELCQIYVNSLSRHDQEFLLKKYFERGYHNKPFTSDSFDRKIVAFFNNMTREAAGDNKVISEVTWMAIENCDALLKACISGGLESKKKSEIIVNLLTQVRPVTTVTSTISGIPLILTHLLNQIEHSSSDDRFPYLVELLCKNKLIDSQQFLLSHIIPKLTESISANNMASITHFMDIMIVTEPFVVIQTGHHVAFLARALNKLRPRIHSFNLDACEATTRCITLLNTAVERYMKRKENEDDEVKWLRSLAERLSPLTRIYLDPLWNRWGKTPTDSEGKAWHKRGFGYDEKILDLEDKERAVLVTYLVKTIPLLTSSEWENIAGGQREMADPRLSYSVFTILADCILVLFQVPFNASDGKLAQSPGIKSCLAYSLSNFLAMVKFVCVGHLLKWTIGHIDSAKNKLDQISANLPDGLNSEVLLESVRMHFKVR